MGYKFAEEKAEKLEQSDRYANYRPMERLKFAGLQKGERVLDVGSGTGFYTRAAAQVVHESGSVVGVDILKGMIDKAISLGVPANVEYRQSEESSFPVEDDEFDWVIMTNLFHELDKPDAFIREIARVLKSGGSVYTADWIPMEQDEGPPKHHRIAKSVALEAFQHQGFTVESDTDLHNSHYELVLKYGSE